MGQGAGEGKDGAICGLGKGEADAGRDRLIHDNGAGVDAMLLDGPQHKTAELIISPQPDIL